MLPGMRVPSAEQKQSGKTHCVVSQSGARFGSVSTAKWRVIGQFIWLSYRTLHEINHVPNWIWWYLLHAFSSDSSLHSGLPLQNSSLSIHSPLPHDNFPSGQIGSSVLKMGNTFLGSKIVAWERKRYRTMDDGEVGWWREKKRETKLATKHYKITIHHATVSVLMWKKSVCVIFLCRVHEPVRLLLRRETMLIGFVKQLRKVCRVIWN